VSKKRARTRRAGTTRGGRRVTLKPAYKALGVRIRRLRKQPRTPDVRSAIAALTRCQKAITDECGPTMIVFIPTV